VQGYNAQAVTTLEQVIVAAELTQDANDFQQLAPMLDALTVTLVGAGSPSGLGRWRPTRATGRREPDRVPRHAGAADPAAQARPSWQSP
jgi:hypothetical protein